ncbi:GntR family transcriptional regulator [Youngiibacter multivorans]|uniref:DNA-binding GntR family transcriptional regulator n=1 Tax=Youngiibacter multivorans TaxID=937251 RepID=A0ABS4G780_9CLOT|nr:GntR family transcriptional regulator [Youngiibacter multivorans]MBP1920428.1 DNA-binding GntR family transcriptional regulator [Youngiibacter multivorans]
MNSELSLKENIYNGILENIFNHKYRANQILNEKSLVEEFGCSKSPVREALIALCNDNVLRNIPRYGYEVVKLTMDDVKEMLQFRYFIESGILKLFYTKITPNQILKLREIDERCNLSLNRVWDHWECNTEFHLKLISFSNNDYIYDELQRCMSRLKRAYAQFYWDKWDENEVPLDTKNHSSIIDRIESRDINGIISALRKDIDDFAGMQLSVNFGD